jgi:voltage-gated potassium channel
MQNQSISRQFVSKKLSAGLIKGVLGIGLIILAGTIGYRIIEHWSWIDALYQTVITISTVGSMEVHPLSQEGRIFTMLLILFGVGTATFCVTLLMEFLLQRSLTNVLGRKLMNKKIRLMKNHTIICGCGRTGSRIIEQLHAADIDFVVIENNEEIAKRLQESDVPHILGDATDEEVLVAANIAEAESLVAALSSDADNLYLTLTANGLSEKLRIIARVNDPDSGRKLKRAGASRVVSPVSSGANQIAQLITSPSLVDLVELVTKDRSIALQIQEHPINEESPLLNKTLAEGHVRQVLGSMVIAVRRASGRTTFDPPPHTRLQLGDALITITNPKPEDEATLNGTP